MTSRQALMGMTFTSQTHTHVYPSIDPKNAKVPSGLNVILIGVSRDIGANTAYSFAHAGAAGIAICSPSEAENVASPIPEEITKINPEINFHQGICDVGDPASIEAFSKDVAAKFGTVDVVVYNCGWFGKWETRAHPTPFEFDMMFDVHDKGCYLAIYYFLPLMKESTTKAFVSVTSIGALAPGGPTGLLGYCTSKFAQVRVIQFLAARDPDVFFAAIHPGNVNTELARLSSPAEHVASLQDQPDLCGGFVVWLISEKKMWLSGRYLSANWDVDELVAKEKEIVEEDKLKFRMAF